METYIKAGNVIKYELTNAGYDVDIGVNRFTSTITVNVNESGSQQVSDVIPSVFEHLKDGDEEGKYIYAIPDEDEALDFMDENYDEEDFDFDTGGDEEE